MENVSYLKYLLHGYMPVFDDNGGTQILYSEVVQTSQLRFFHVDLHLNSYFQFCFMEDRTKPSPLRIRYFMFIVFSGKGV